MAMTSFSHPAKARFFEAGMRGHLDIVNVLVGAGASVNATYCGSAPLIISLEYGHTEIADALVSAGAVESRYVEDNLGWFDSFP